MVDWWDDVVGVGGGGDVGIADGVKAGSVGGGGVCSLQPKTKNTYTKIMDNRFRFAIISSFPILEISGLAETNTFFYLLSLWR